MISNGVQALTAFVAGGTLENSAFREMVHALPVAVYTTDAQGCLTYFNAAAVKLSGRTPELGTDKWCVTWKIFLPDGTPLPHDQCPMAVALKGAEVPTGVECIAERPDGTRFWFTPCPAVIRDPEGRIVGGINLLVDITDRKNAEIEANEQFRAIVETTPECVKIIAPDGTLLFMNAPGLGMVGAASVEMVIGKSIYDIIAAEDRDRFREFNERICQGERASLEFDIVGLKGARRHMETHAAPLRHADGTTVHVAITHDITERKRVERAALLLSAIVDSSDDAIISKDLNGIITSWNAGAVRLFGYTAAETVGQPVAMLIPADRQEEEPKILARLKRGERVDHFETVRRRKDGAPLDISLTISPVKDAQDTIIGASKIARDISERKRAERAIQTLNAQLTADLDAMARLQQLSTRMIQMENLPQLLDEILAVAIDITRADMGNVDLLEGGSLKIVSQRGFEDSCLAFFDGIRDGQAPWDMAMGRGESLAIEDVASIPVSTGTPARPIMLNAGAKAVQSTPLVSRGGELLGMLSTYYRTPSGLADRDLRLLDILARQAADLIERQYAQATLLASEARFKQLADTMPQIVWTANSDGHVDYYNERWYEFTGFGREAFGDKSWESILHPEDLPTTRESWYAAVESGKPYNIEYRFLDRKERRWRWFVGRAVPVRDERGSIVKWFGSCTDIDEQKRVQNDLQRANEDLEQFAFSASHDLQEPLRTVNIYTELLARRYGQAFDGEALKFMQFVRNGAKRMEALVRDLLTYTQATKLETVTEATDANEVLNTVCSNLTGAVSEAGATIRAEPLPSLPVHGMHLQQLLQNLIGNAIKYRSPDRTPLVHVSAERQNGHWILSVRDNGIGIDAMYKENIFGLFKRLHTNDEYSGTGIGLAICQRIVERYHGRIWVESEPGQGSTFRFTLPV